MPEHGEVTLWRLVKAQYCDTAFDGEGAFRYGGRWNSRGHRVVYTSATLSLALLEVLVHLDPAGAIPEMVALSVRIPQSRMQTAPFPTSRADALGFPWTLRHTRTLGDDWLQRAGTPVLCVPSAIVPLEQNYLINPLHPAFGELTISEAIPFRFDSRLIAGL